MTRNWKVKYRLDEDSLELTISTTEYDDVRERAIKALIDKHIPIDISVSHTLNNTYNDDAILAKAKITNVEITEMTDPNLA